MWGSRTALVEHGAILQWHAASFQFSPASLSAIAERQLASDFKPPAENSLVFFSFFSIVNHTSNRIGVLLC